jgi:hypothetical protein
VKWLTLIVVVLPMIAWIVTSVVIGIERGRIPGGRTFSETVWVYRYDSASLFWLMIGLRLALIPGLIWLVLA